MISSSRRSRDGVGLAFVVIAAIAVVVLVALAVRSNPPAAPTEPDVPVAVGAAGQAAAPGGQAGGLQVEAVANPEDEATAVLAKEYGVVCTNASDVTVQENPDKLKDLDSKIAAKALKEGWIDEGSTYLGDGAGAAKAFKASKAFGDEASVWIVVAGDKPSAMELRSVETPKGHKVWAIVNWVTAC